MKPGTEGVLALGLAHVILANKLRPATTGPVAESIAGWSNGLSDYTPARVEQITGVAAKRVERLARELTDVSPAVAIVGGAPLAHTNAHVHRACRQRAQRIAGRGECARRPVFHAGT